MGIELDVLVGHPEHDLLFVATQVARAAGLKNPSNAVSLFRKSRKGAPAIAIQDLPESGRDWRKPIGHVGGNGRTLPSHTSLMDEPTLYLMLLRGNAPASESFRKWVTEEVLPTIRKTGKYGAGQSTNPIAQGVMDGMNRICLENAERDQSHSSEISELRAQCMLDINSLLKA